jgi:hypothetical protein
MTLAAFLLLSAIAVPGADSSPQLPTADQVVARMVARDNERQATLFGYTGTRHYVLENSDFQKRAEMLVRMTCLRDGSKQFQTISATGWGGARKHVFPKLLESETEASQPGLRARSRIIPENYAFEMIGTEYIDDRPTYVIAIAPKTSNKYLIEGRIWIDAADYAIVRIEGKPARNPSFWIKSVHFVHSYEKRGSFWFPLSDRSVTDARIFGRTEVTIDYFDYSVTRPELAKTNSLPRAPRDVQLLSRSGSE